MDRPGKQDLAYYKKKLEFLRNFIDIFTQRYDIIISRPAKPLPYGKLKCGGFFSFWGIIR